MIKSSCTEMSEVKKFPAFFEKFSVELFLENFVTVVYEPLDEVVDVADLRNGALRWRIGRNPTQGRPENDGQLGGAHFVGSLVLRHLVQKANQRFQNR